MISKAEAQCIVDNKSTHPVECIRELKSEKDKLAPISNLPPEILATIFYFVSIERTHISPFFPCYYFTHVSRLWRSVALNTPNLWQVLPRSIHWADVVLERSKGAELVVRANSLPLNSPRLMFLKRVLLNHTSRIRQLGLSNVSIPALATLVENLPRSSLRLRSLELSSFELFPPPFPIGVLETDILQTLDINRCMIGNWYSLSFPALTSLVLRHVSPGPPLIDFLEMLRGVPSLRVLDMERLPLANDPIDRLPSVHLPNLRHLSLRSRNDPKEIINLLTFIIVPLTASLRLAAKLRTPEEAETIGPQLVSSFSTIFDHLRHGLESPYNRLDLTARRGILILYASKDEISPELVLILGTLTSLDFASHLLQIIPCFPFLTITNLTLDLGVTFLCMETFGRLPRLQDISVHGECTAELIRALSFKPEHHNTEPVMSFPALRSLCILAYCSTGRKRGLNIYDAASWGGVNRRLNSRR